MNISSELNNLIGNSLEFRFIDGRVTEISYPHETGWREMPLTVIAQLTKGYGKVEFSNPDKTVLVNEGDCFIASSRRHRFRLLSKGKAISRWGHYEFRVLETIDFLSLLDFSETFSGTTARQIGDICEQISKISFSGDIRLEKIVNRKELGYNLLKLLLKNSQIKSNAGDILLRNQRLTPVLSFMDKNYHTEISPEFLAKTVNLSVPRFYSIFKETIGISPLEYLQQVRLQKSKQLLAVTNLNLAEITEKIGFKDQFHFSKRFKKLFGISPSEYRSHFRVN